MKKTFIDLPFELNLSLNPLIKFIENYSTNGIPEEFAKSILKDISQNKEISSEKTTEAKLKKQHKIVDKMLSVVIAPAFKQKNLFATVAPFGHEAFYISEPFKHYMGNKTNFNEFIDFDSDEMSKMLFMAAYTVILRQFYNIDIHFEQPLVVSFDDPNSKTTKYYRLRAFPNFIEFKAKGKLRKLSEDQIYQLLDNMDDSDLWLKTIPPEQFEINGFTILDAVDITDLEILSLMKRDILEAYNYKEALIGGPMRERITSHLRNLLKKPDLEIGLVFLTGDKLDRDEAHPLGHSIFFNDNVDHSKLDLGHSAYQYVIDHEKPMIIHDLDSKNVCSTLHQLRSHKYKNLFVAPIKYENAVIGLLEIGSPNARDINQVNSLKLEKVYPLFATAFKRGFDEFYNEMQKEIKEKCTNIHPSVEWRFQKAAYDYLKAKKTDPSAQMEEIVFSDVYPLYAVSDIRNSSNTRNLAIQKDLIEQLELTKDIISQAYQVKELPYLDELRFRIDSSIKQITAELHTGDELTILEFLRKEVEPTFVYLKDINTPIQIRISHYQELIANKHGILYKERKKFENSISIINDTISDYLEHQEDKAQQMYPHYFERYKTDGVEHSMYIGKSMVENLAFDKLYLKNLRLWQLMTTCVIVKKTHDVISHLELPLDTAHLVLVQDMPLSIRFRMDEKHFDVDGAYNIRYEMLKKRIDKATILNTGERLTQPNHIAIVYTQQKEAAEYKKYIDYLHSIDYIEDTVEDVELEYLQGAHGLRALRIKVNLTLSEMLLETDNYRQVVG